MKTTNEELLSLCKESLSVLNRIPAFGDSIGNKVTKAQLGLLQNMLKRAIERAESELADKQDKSDKPWAIGRGVFGV